ncbi:hypothetical protein Tco_0503396 [Tanacetum coccineum]
MRSLSSHSSERHRDDVEDVLRITRTEQSEGALGVLDTLRADGWGEEIRLAWHITYTIQRISLTGFPAQSVGSSNTDVLDSPCLLVLVTGTSQSRQHVITSLIHIESCKSPTKSLFDVAQAGISIFTVNT